MNSDATATLSTDPEHPIAVVSDRTGLSRDVLRVWERRYHAVDPARSAGGQRLYSDAQVERFRLLSAATQHGRSISQVAPLSTEQLSALIAHDDAERRSALTGGLRDGSAQDNPPRDNSQQNNAPQDDSKRTDDGGPVAVSPEGNAGLHATYAAAVAALYACTRRMDGPGLDRELRRAITRHGLPVVLDQIIPGLMHIIGDDWAQRRLGIAEEHLATAAVLAVVSDAIRAVPDSGTGPRLLVATPSGERHGLGAALVAASAALEGWSIIQLGIDLPAADIVSAAAATGARAVALSVVHADDAVRTLEQLRTVREELPAEVALILGGAAVMKLRDRLTQPGMEVCENLASLRRVLSLQNP